MKQECRIRIWDEEEAQQFIEDFNSARITAKFIMYKLQQFNRLVAFLFRREIEVNGDMRPLQHIQVATQIENEQRNLFSEYNCEGAGNVNLHEASWGAGSFNNDKRQEQPLDAINRIFYLRALSTVVQPRLLLPLKPDDTK